MNITAHIRKTDALDRPWYVDYTIESAKYDVRVDIKATGFDCYGAAHAHATAMGAEIVDDVQTVGGMVGGVIGRLFGGRADPSKPTCQHGMVVNPPSERFAEYMRTGVDHADAHTANEQAGERARDAVLSAEEWMPDEAVCPNYEP